MGRYVKGVVLAGAVATRAEGQPVRSSDYRLYLKAYISELIAAKLSQDHILRRLKDEKRSISRGKLVKILDVLREEWRQKASTNSDALVSEELASLDTLQAKLWGKALNGDTAMVDRVIRIMEHRAKLLGLYAPQQKRIVGEVSIIKAYLDLDVEKV